MAYKKMSPFLLTLLVTAMNFVQADGGCGRAEVCPENPLYCHGWNLSAYAGPSPIVWASRDCIRFLNTPINNSTDNSHCSVTNTCNASPICNPSPICSPTCITPSPCFASDSGTDCSTADCSLNSVAAIKIPKFSKLFHTPWTVGADLGYALTENHELLIEANYTQASRKNNACFTTCFATTVDGTVLQPQLNGKYRNVSGYVGYRYNFNRACRNISWFVDVKAGVIHHFKIRGLVISTLENTIATPLETACFPIFNSNTAFSGAAEVGLDICITCDWSMIIGAEVAAAWGPSCKQYARPVGDIGSNNITSGKIGAEILFPITFGLRYRF